MADLDFITDLRDQFQVSLTDNPRKITGNKALLNRFEITFLTKRRLFLLGDTAIFDNYGGDANKFIGVPKVLGDSQSISAAISVAIDQTVDSMKKDEPGGIPDTEKIDKAELTELNIISDIVTAKIRVYPVEVESYDVLEFNLPIIRSQ